MYYHKVGITIVKQFDRDINSLSVLSDDLSVVQIDEVWTIKKASASVFDTHT